MLQSIANTCNNTGRYYIPGGMVCIMRFWQNVWVPMIYTSSFHAGPGNISDLQHLKNQEYNAVLVTPTESPDRMISSLAGIHYGHIIYTSAHGYDIKNRKDVHGVGMVNRLESRYKKKHKMELFSHQLRNIPYLYNVSPSCTDEERTLAQSMGCLVDNKGPLMINGKLGRVIISHNRIRFWWQSNAKYVFVCAGGVGKSDFSQGLRGETSGVRAYVIVSDSDAGGNYVYNNKYNEILIGSTSFPTVHRLSKADDTNKEPAMQDNVK